MSTATKVRAVCQFCGRKSGWTEPRRGGQVDLWGIGKGWSVAPFSPSFEHFNGTHGDRATCPACNATNLIGKRPGAWECTEAAS